MGLAGGLVKRVFPKQRSPCGRDANVDKNRWSLSKLNFCGDDFDSVHDEVNDLTSFECSVLTVTQPMVGTSETSITLPSSESAWKAEGSNEGINGDVNEEDNKGETKASEEECQQGENAALIIQSAFRRFLARRQQKQTTEHLGGAQGCMESPSRASLGTSVEVQVGDSVKTLPVRRESIGVPQRIPHKARRHTFRLKEEWDDSTVSSNISKLRVQKRLEAMTRRERALAYAFSQQLRVCSNKKKQARNDFKESNMSWTWLERWMATRRPECPLSEDNSSRQLQCYMDHRPSILSKKFDIDLEESCGSNDVPVSCENSVIPSLSNLKDGYKAVKNRLKAPKDTKRRINTPSHHCTAPPNKVIKSLRKMEKKKTKEANTSKAARDLPA